MSNIYIETLKNEVAQRFGREPSSTKQFNALSIEISATIGETLSVSTLKRLWGYVSGGNNPPRTSSLDILSRYIGKNGYQSFLQYVQASANIQSDFCSDKSLSIDKLSIGDRVELSWLPNRRVEFTYLGGYRWRVEHNENSKLCTDAIVIFSTAIAGEPLYADVQLPGQSTARPYIAGSRSGISFRILE